MRPRIRLRAPRSRPRMSSTAKGVGSNPGPKAGLDDLVQQIQTEIALAEQAQRAGLQHAIRAGELLIEAKGRMGHGEWLPWLDRYFSQSIDTAGVYMRLARNSEHARNFGSVREALAAVKDKED